MELKKVLYRQLALARSPRFQVETAFVLDRDGVKRVVKRPLFPEGVAHLQRMAANAPLLAAGIAPTRACPCRMEGNVLTMEFVDGISVEQKLTAALGTRDIPAIVAALVSYRDIVTNQKHCSTLGAMADPLTVFGDDVADWTGELVLSGNIDQGFDHLIFRDDQPVLIDYEWVLGFPVPVNYVLYRSIRLFHGKLRPALSSIYGKARMCDFFGITPEEGRKYDRMEASFQSFVRR